MEISIKINDALASNALNSLVEIAKILTYGDSEQAQIKADTQQFGLQQSGIQSLLSFLGTLITAKLQNSAENTSSGIMPMLLGMMMGNNGFSPSKTDTSSAAKDSEKPTPEPENSENSEE